MSFSYQLGSNPSIDYPRLLIGDTVSAGHIFEDEEINAVSTMNLFAVISPSGGGQLTSTANTASPFFVAATLLETIGALKARASVKRLLDVEIDAQAAAKMLKDMAATLRAVEQTSGAFAIIEQCPDAFSMRERLYNQLLRLVN